MKEYWGPKEFINNKNFLFDIFEDFEEADNFADEVIKNTAFCPCCGRPARFTQRLIDGFPAKEGPIEFIGDTESYEPRCRNCYVPPYKA